MKKTSFSLSETFKELQTRSSISITSVHLYYSKQLLVICKCYLQKLDRSNERHRNKVVTQGHQLHYHTKFGSPILTL